MVDLVPVSQMILASLLSGILLNIWKVWKEGRLQMAEYIFVDFLGGMVCWRGVVPSWQNHINCYTDVIPKSTFIFHYHLASYHKMTPEHPGSQSESDASCLDSHISDKQDSKALWLLWLADIAVVILLLLRDRAGDERLHTDRRPIYTGFR